VGIVGGAILYRVHVVIATLASSAPTCLIVLGALALYFIAAALLGYVISLAVDKGAIIGKNRNLRAAKAVGFISGLASYGVYVSVYFAALGGEGLDSAIDVIKLVGYFLAIVLVAGIASGEAIAGTPFCEKDEEFMKKIVLGKYPIRHERALMEILASRKLVDLRDVVADLKLAENFTEVTAWHCDRCKETGFISAKTTQTRYEHDAKGNRTAKSETRLIYSSSLEKPGILAILAHAQPNQA
jgi:YD repeat-containing protein